MLVINASVIIFIVSECISVYFDDHYHVYVINNTSNQLLITTDQLHDFNVYHMHKLSDGKEYITLKYHMT